MVETNWSTMKIVLIVCVVVVLCCAVFVGGMGLFWWKKVKRQHRQVNVNSPAEMVPQTSADINLDGGATPLADSGNTGEEMFAL